MTKAQLEDVLDPLSAAFLHARSDNTGDFNVCRRTLPVFDGRQRFDIVLTPKRAEEREDCLARASHFRLLARRAAATGETRAAVCPALLTKFSLLGSHVGGMKFGTFLLAAGLVLPASGALTEPVTVTADAGALADTPSLSADELRQAITGKTVYLDVSGFELPIHYLANGRMSGSMGTVAASFSRGDGASDTGRWWIEANQLCQRWTSWMEGQTYCYQLTRQGDTVQWSRNDGRSGTARIGD